MTEPAPIILFIYNRPDHTKQTIEALQNNDLAASSTLFVFADGPKQGASEEQLQKIRKTRELFVNCKGFKQVIVKERTTNQGLAKSVIEGVTQVINEYGRVIVLEDDIIAGKGFLTFMNAGLSFYEQQQDVISLSAYTLPIKADGLSETFFLRGADCWGWATWKRGWQIFEADAQKLYTTLVEKQLTHVFDFDGAYPYTKMLQDQINRKIDSWAIRWHAAAFLANKLTLYPRVSLVKNIGLDGSGTHGKNDEAMAAFHADYCKVDRIAVQESIKARNRVKRYFAPAGPRVFIKKLIGKSKSVTKRSIRKFAPPIFFDLLRSVRKKNVSDLWWQGSFDNWESARKQAKGYDDQLILDKVNDSLLKVKNGEAVYERDSVLFDKVEYSWPVLACLQRIALEKKHAVRVLDFGGSLGSSYFQNRAFLKDVLNMEWHIVEQPHFVERGRKHFESDQLHFHTSIDEACLKHSIDCLFLSSVLQYLPNPKEWIDSFLEKNFEYILIDRNSFIEDDRSRLTMQTVPEYIYKASYPCWFFNEDEFLALFSTRYQRLADFDSYADLPTSLEDGKRVYWKGYFLKRK